MNLQFIGSFGIVVFSAVGCYFVVSQTEKGQHRPLKILLLFCAVFFTIYARFMC